MTRWWCPSCAIKRNVLVTALARAVRREARAERET